jgi:HD-like signal output (HDOD) protein
MPDKEELVDYLKNSQLCALPQSASQMIALSKDPENGPQEYAKPISADLGLSTQVLRFVNSSFFGFRHKITSIPLALTLVSVRTIHNFVLWNGLFVVLPKPRCGPFLLKTLFRDALRRAVFARIIAERYTQLDNEEAFTCALMQDVAIPFLAKKWGDAYTEMFKKSNSEYVRLSTLEHEVMGWDHAEAGAILAENWNLGENISKAVSQHIGGISLPPHTCEPTFTGITALSALLPKVPDQEWFEVLNFVDTFRGMFGHKLADLFEVLHKTDTDSNQLAEMINLGSVPKSLNEFWRETLSGYSWTGADNILATEEQLDEMFTQAALQPERRCASISSLSRI